MIYESPFDEPLAGRQAIYEYWHEAGQRLKDKTSSYELLSVQGDLGIARWRSQFTVIESGKRLDLDCLFLVTFDGEGRCREFREWWFSRELPAG